MNRILISNGTAVLPQGVVHADILIEGEKIAAIGPNLHASKDTLVIDAKDHLVFPGLIDSHIHFHLEAGPASSPHDFFNGSLSAVFGGVTTVLDFTEQRNFHSLRFAVNTKLAEAQNQSVADYSLHCTITALTNSMLDEMSRLSELGISSLKCYMTYRDRGLMLSDIELGRILAAAKDHSQLVCVHAEDETLSQSNIIRLASLGHTEAKYHAQSKPNEVEVTAIKRAISLAKHENAPIFICHVSTREGVELIRKAKAEGQPVYAETCIHYLTLTSDYLQRQDGALWICSPPLRSEADQETLWAGLKDGTLSLVSTDDAAFWKSDKLGVKSFVQVPNGLSGIEVRLPLLHTLGVETGRLSLSELVKLTSTNPAKLFGMYPRKGTIEVGSDADLVIFDPSYEWQLAVDTLHSPLDWCAYERMRVKGIVASTILRGRPVIENREFIGQKGMGQFIHRNTSDVFDKLSVP